MNLYPGQLRRLADMCEALNKVDETGTPRDLVFKNRIVVHDPDSSTEVYGYLVDEIGGAWSFQPVAEA